MHPDFDVGEASREELFALPVGEERAHGESAGLDVHFRLGGVNLGAELLVAPLDGEREARAGLDLVGVPFGDEEVYLQRRDFRELGHHDVGRGVGAFADVAQADHPVEGGVQLREGDVRLHDVDVGVEHRQFGAGLFVGLLAHGVLFEQGALAVNAVFGQLALRLVARELRLQGPVVHLGQQLALAHGGSLPEIDLHDLARGLEREVHLLVGKQVADGRDAVGERLRADDHSVHVQDVLLSRRGERLRPRFRVGAVMTEIVISQRSAEYGENRGGRNPSLLFVHCAKVRFRFGNRTQIYDKM